MAVTWLAELDPVEQLIFSVDWSKVLNATVNERITASLWEASPQAGIDGHAGTLDLATNTATEIELTGGVIGTDYTWLHTVDTVDDNSKTQKRRRSMVIKVREK